MKDKIPYLYRKLFDILQRENRETLNFKDFKVLLSRKLGINKFDCKHILKEMEEYGLVKSIKQKNRCVRVKAISHELYLKEFNYVDIMTANLGVKGRAVFNEEKL